MKHPTLPSPVTGAARAVICLALAASAQAFAAVLFNDTFTDVAASSDQNSAGLNDAGWYFYNTSSSGYAWTIGTADNSPLSGNVLRNQGSSAQATYAIRQWDTVTLANVGDSISVTMDVRANNYTVNDVTRLFSISLLNSAVTLDRNYFQSSNPLSSATGYAWSQVFDANVAHYNQVSNGLTLNQTGDPLSGVPVINNGATHSIGFTLTRVSEGIAISAILDGVTYASFVDTSLATTSFNTLVLRANADWQVNTRFDNVRVEFSSIPETKTAALLAGSVALAGTLAFARRRPGLLAAAGLACMGTSGDGVAGDVQPATDAGYLVAEVSVDLTRPSGREVKAELFGVALPRSERHMKDDRFIERMPSLQTPFLSLSLGGFGGVVSDLNQPADWSKLDASLSRLKEIHSGPILVALGGPRIAAKGGWFDISSEEHRRFWAGVVVEAARRVADAGVRAEWWELWNEPDGAWGKADTASFEHLWQLYNLAARELKVFDPTLKIGGPALAWPYRDIIRRYLAVCGEHVDFVSYHQYGTGRLDHPTDLFLTRTASRYGDEAAEVSRLVREALPGRKLPVLLTEYNMNYGWKPGEARQQTGVNAVFTTRALLHAAAGGLDMASIWGAYGDAQFGLITPETGRIAPVGHTLRQLAKWAPGALVDAVVANSEPDGNATPLQAFATLNPDRRGYTVILTNHSENTEVMARVSARMPSVRAIVTCNQFEVSPRHPEGTAQEIPLVPQMMEITVPPMSVVLQQMRFDSVM
ncbi:alpha-L-arabinofuranosidase [Opitutaceae bacterium TAV1]|nr:alpha-L-arabinofuranosidase [Opitutaceae bacterium TAV1]